ncbi:hypothetical protein FACS1894216_16240 [Synergistales bacterium]|nr:hypothetical protein FACS1894216_16240 [Synergistales bacterium]
MFANYNTDSYDPNAVSFEPIPIGAHRIRVEEAEEGTSKNGNAMIKVTFSVSGHKGKLFHYFVDNEWIQRNLDPFFDSFGIQPGNFNLLTRRGKVGACVVKHEMYDGGARARISYFVLKSKQKDIPAWKEDWAARKSSARPFKVSSAVFTDSSRTTST